MADKPDYYQVLGVDKKASKADIQSAYKRIAMKNHPDVIKHKQGMSQAEKDAALQKFKDATEAEGVLTDDVKRAAYDQYGHKGLENLAAGKNAKSGQSYTDAAGTRMKRGPFTEEDTFSFFEKRKEQHDRENPPGTDDGLTSEQRRERARQERLAKRRGGGDSSTTPSVKDPFDSASATNVFKDIGEKTSEAAEALKNGVTVPFEALEKFRDNLEDFLGEVNKAIARSRPPGPKHP